MRKSAFSTASAILTLLASISPGADAAERSSLYALCTPGIRYQGASVTHRLIIDARTPVKFMDQGAERACDAGASFEMSAALPDSFEPFYCLPPSDARAFLELDPESDRTIMIQSSRKRDGVDIEGQLSFTVEDFNWDKDSQSGTLELRIEERGKIRYRWGKERKIDRKLDLTCAVQTEDPRH